MFIRYEREITLRTKEIGVNSVASGCWKANFSTERESGGTARNWDYI